MPDPEDYEPKEPIGYTAHQPEPPDGVQDDEVDQS